MRIKMNSTAAGPDGVYQSGGTYEVDDAFARAMIASQFADPVDFQEDPAPVVPAKPARERLDGAAEVEIPEGWTDLPAKALKELAALLASPAATSRNEAIEVIQAELAARAA